MRRWKLWSGVIAVEGRETLDGRLIRPGALTWEAEGFPLLLVGTPESSDYWDRRRVGTIEHIERLAGGIIRGEGFLTGDLPELLDLGVFVDHAVWDEHSFVPQVLNVGRIRSVTVGDEKCWDECVLEVVEDDQQA